MSSLREQKATGKESYRHDLAKAGTVPSSEESNAGASFMGHKPGGSDTLPGWEKAKGVINGYVSRLLVALLLGRFADWPITVFCGMNK